jgi:hypothetical protein
VHESTDGAASSYLVGPGPVWCALQIHPLARNFRRARRQRPAPTPVLTPRFGAALVVGANRSHCLAEDAQR